MIVKLRQVYVALGIHVESCAGKFFWKTESFLPPLCKTAGCAWIQMVSKAQRLGTDIIWIIHDIDPQTGSVILSDFTILLILSNF